MLLLHDWNTVKMSAALTLSGRTVSNNLDFLFYKVFGPENIAHTSDAQVLQIVLTVDHLKRFKYLQTNTEKIEYNGEIVIDEPTGNVLRVVERRGQYVEPCNKGCVINWHTHPQDYSKYYPDHPSAQDMKYVLFAISKTRELVAHLVFTPEYVYALTLSQKLMQLDPAHYESKSAEIDALFDRVSALHGDRATEAFRTGWLQGLRALGFVIDRFTGYSSPISLQLRKIDRAAIRNMEADRKRKAQRVSKLNADELPTPSTFEKLVVCLLVAFFVRWAVM